MTESEIVEAVLRALPRNTRFVECIQRAAGCSYVEAEAAIEHAYAPGCETRRPLGLLTICAVSAIGQAIGTTNQLVEQARAFGYRPHPAIVAAEMVGRRIRWKAVAA